MPSWLVDHGSENAGDVGKSRMARMMIPVTDLGADGSQNVEDSNSNATVKVRQILLTTASPI